MKVVPASSALTDFMPRRMSAASDVRKPDGGTPGGDTDDGMEAERRGREERELAEHLARAFEDGARQGRKEAEAAFERERERLTARHAEELKRLEHRWKKEVADHLAQEFRRSVEELGEALERRLADILVPVLEEAARRSALERLRDLLQGMIAGDEALRIRVCADPDVLRELQDGLGDLAAAMEPVAVEGGGERVVVHVDNTVIETRVAEWARDALPLPGTDEKP